MPKPLVVVESPAKAKTLSKFLGNDYDVRASVGHVADLPSKGLNIDVDNGFKPTYELTERGKTVIKELRAALKDASELYLATDEDREGEAISWHLLEYLKPKVPVKRMVFHEITKSAIDHAVNNPRSLDYGLVDAAETRRILDRLYGYEVSPVLWRRVNRGLSAGRVQSPSVRLIVSASASGSPSCSADYWDIDAVTATAPSFTAKLVTRQRHQGRHRQGLRRPRRGRPPRPSRSTKHAPAALAEGLADAPFTVRSVEEKPYRSSPKAPFMTSTLQQEGGRKLRMSSSQVMRVAQGLYERGYITYMRTDNVVLSDEAMQATRAAVTSQYGQQYLSPSPKQYSSKVKNARRPTRRSARPRRTARRSRSAASSTARTSRCTGWSGSARWRRRWPTPPASRSACASAPTPSTVPPASWPTASSPRPGTTITFPGYRAVYAARAEASDARRRRRAEQEALLPPLAEGDVVPIESITPEGHTTSPPARYTEASLVKRLEELGIGRPSTWASIIQTIQDRGYVWKKGQALVPTWTAFAVIRLLEEHFDALVDYDFTASIDDDLDEIARGDRAKDQWLKRFYFGDTGDGDTPADRRRGGRRRGRAARPEAAGRGEPRRDRCRRKVFSTPIIAQQISLPDALNGKYAGDPALARLLGYEVAPSRSVTAWRERRLARSADKRRS